MEADRLRGKLANCRIKTKKEDGQLVNIVAGCATDIMLSNVQFSLKVLVPNKISRTFPGTGYGNQLLPLSDLITLADQPPRLARMSD